MKFTQLNIERTLSENNIKKYKLKDGFVEVKTTSKKKLNKLKEEFNRDYEKISNNKYRFKLQEQIDILKLIKEFSEKGIGVNVNKNIMYIFGKHVTKDFAEKVAKKYGGEYTEHNNPFLNRGYYRINFYDEKGLFIFDAQAFAEIEEEKKKLGGK